MSQINLKQTAAISIGNPPTGKTAIFTKDGVSLSLKKEDGTVTDLGSGGSVTSVDLTLPSFLSVSGNPITTSGTFEVSLATQAANRIFAGPSTGVDAAPTFRALVASDIPALSYEPPISAGTSAQYYRGDKTFQTLDTDAVPEASNLYYTAARFNSAFSGKSTTDLAEGSNLYFTNARGIGSVLTGFTAGAGIVAATDTILEAIQKLSGSLSFTAGSILYAGASGIPSEDNANFFYDYTNKRFAIGTNTPTHQFHFKALANEYVNALLFEPVSGAKWRLYFESGYVYFANLNEAYNSLVLDNGGRQGCGRSPDGTQFHVQGAAARTTEPSMKITQVASQTAGFIQFLDSSATLLSQIDVNGNFTGNLSGDIGFFGTTPVSQQASSGAATAGGSYTATEQTMIQEMYDALRAYGLLS